jgi:phage shock protein A
MPPDVTAELKNARKEAEAQTAEIARLETDIAELEARKRSLQDEFAAYRQKYRLK